MSGFNYFNYFTEIEEYFWRKRGAHLLVSPLDWAIVETWQKSGVPLRAVLRGIDRAFEGYQRSRRGASGRPLKSLAYCVDAVMEAAEEDKGAAAGAGPVVSAQRAEPFSRDELRAFFQRNIDTIGRAAHKCSGGLASQLADTREKLTAMLPIVESPGKIDLEDLERRLTILEERLTNVLSANADDEILLKIRREMDRALAPYKRKMTPEQITQLQRQYTQKRLFEEYQVPRLSLFYLT